MSTIERLKQLEAGATPGPWYYRDSDESICDIDDNILFPGWSNPKLQGPDNDWSDVLLVTQMRNALPKLLAVVEAARWQLMDNPEETQKGLEDALAALEDE